MKIKEIVKGIIYGYKFNDEKYIRHLRDIGMSVGEDVSIYTPMKTLIDECYPWMIQIGNHVRIAEGVKILAHDYSWSVLKRHYNGEILGASGKVHIGNNVFIGMNAIILRGVEIGDNVVIGAGSVVTKNCEPNGVYAGNPAVRVCEIDAFYHKRKDAQLQEARELAVEYYKRYAKFPPKEVFHEYFMLFTDPDAAKGEPVYMNKMKLCDNPDQSMEFISNNVPRFCNYDEFMKYCFENETHSHLHVK